MPVDRLSRLVAALRNLGDGGPRAARSRLYGGPGRAGGDHAGDAGVTLTRLPGVCCCTLILRQQSVGDGGQVPRPGSPGDPEPMRLQDLGQVKTARRRPSKARRPAPREPTPPIVRQGIKRVGPPHQCLGYAQPSHVSGVCFSK
jgi:hypothetical protein